MFGRVMAEVRRQVGPDFPVGVRFLAEEAIKEGYTVEDAKLIGLRMAQLGVDYISLSVGGKFEDAVNRGGQPIYPYTGYSGDRSEERRVGQEVGMTGRSPLWPVDSKK